MLNESKRKVWRPELAWDGRMKRYPTGEKFNERKRKKMREEKTHRPIKSVASGEDVEWQSRATTVWGTR